MLCQHISYRVHVNRSIRTKRGHPTYLIARPLLVQRIFAAWLNLGGFVLRLGGHRRVPALWRTLLAAARIAEQLCCTCRGCCGLCSPPRRRRCRWGRRGRQRRCLRRDKQAPSLRRGQVPPAGGRMRSRRNLPRVRRAARLRCRRRVITVFTPWWRGGSLSHPTPRPAIRNELCGDQRCKQGAGEPHCGQVLEQAPCARRLCVGARHTASPHGPAHVESL